MKKPFSNISMRADLDLKKRFDAVREYRGWSTQKALERIITAWIEEVERELNHGRPKKG